MSITNLNGYTWTGNDTLLLPSTSVAPNMNISCTYGDNSFDIFRFWRLDDWPPDEFEIWLSTNDYYIDDMIYSTEFGGWMQDSHSVTFGDGVDASDANFISWLEENGTLEKEAHDITKLKIEDVIYNIKDTVAREAINNLPKPMIFKGTLGNGGTITTLPTPTAETIGNTYKVTTNGTYAGQSAKVGDMFICGEPDMPEIYEWVYVPSADEEFEDTWRGIKVNGNNFLSSSITSGNIDFVAGNNITLDASSADKSITINSNDVIKSGTGLNSIVQKARPGSEGADANNYASKEGAVALGRYNVSDGICSVVLNYDNTVTGNYGFAANKANNVQSMAGAAFGSNNTVIGQNAFTVGNGNTNYGEDAFAGGRGTVVGIQNLGTAKQAFGYGLGIRVNNNYQAAFGQYNNPDQEDLFEIGYGTETARNNVFAVNRNGRVVIKALYGGSPTLQLGNVTLTDSDVTSLKAVPSQLDNKADKVPDGYLQDTEKGFIAYEGWFDEDPEDIYSKPIQMNFADDAHYSHEDWNPSSASDYFVPTQKAVANELALKVEKFSNQTNTVAYTQNGTTVSATEISNNIDAFSGPQNVLVTDTAVINYAEHKTYTETKDINNDYANLAGGKITIASNSVTSFECDEMEFAIGDTSSIIFTTNSTIGTIEMPSNVKWSVAAPIFEPNTTYWLTFTKLTNTLTVGVWSVLV